MERYWLVCYDVADPKRLRRIAKLMQSFGLRAQKSVFECWLSDGKLKELKEKAAGILDESEDDLRFYSLCETCRKLTTAKTKTTVRNNNKYYIV